MSNTCIAFVNNNVGRPFALLLNNGEYMLSPRICWKTTVAREMCYHIDGGIVYWNSSHHIIDCNVSSDNLCKSVPPYSQCVVLGDGECDDFPICITAINETKYYSTTLIPSSCIVQHNVAELHWEKQTMFFHKCHDRFRDFFKTLLDTWLNRYCVVSYSTWRNRMQTAENVYIISHSDYITVYTEKGETMDFYNYCCFDRSLCGRVNSHMRMEGNASLYWLNNSCRMCLIAMKYSSHGIHVFAPSMKRLHKTYKTERDAVESIVEVFDSIILLPGCVVSTILNMTYKLKRDVHIA